MPHEDQTFKYLMGQLAEHLQVADPPGHLHCIQVECDAPFPDVRILDRVEAGSFRWYWSSRDDRHEQLAWGVADCITSSDSDEAVARIRNALTDLPEEARYVGGLRFDTRTGGVAKWQAYGRAKFWLPRFSMVRVDDSVHFRCYLRGDEYRQLRRTLEQMPTRSITSSNMSSNVSSDEPLQITDRADWPEEGDWNSMVRDILDQIDEGAYRKAVLARRTAFTFNQEIAHVPFFAQLREDTPGCFHFLISPNEQSAFIGSSPERLFRINVRHLTSEAIAGTRPRSGSESWDAVLRDELLSSEKDRLEHRHVQDFLRQSFEKLCVDVKGDAPPQSLALKRGRHLHAAVEGTLRDEISLSDVLRELHPTPAVAGLPVCPVMDYLRKAEPFDRGWYAGAIGWMSRDAAEFAVGIRSALMLGRELNVYAGAGIVPGSHPPQEWKEVEHKIGDYLAQFQEIPAV